MWASAALLCLAVGVANSQDPPDCSGFTVDNLPRPRILLLGPTGQFSCLQNKTKNNRCWQIDTWQFLAWQRPKGRKQCVQVGGSFSDFKNVPISSSLSLFSVGDDTESHTVDISWKVGNWLGSGDCFTVIDTPGISVASVEMWHGLVWYPNTDIGLLNVDLINFDQVHRILRAETMSMHLLWQPY